MCGIILWLVLIFIIVCCACPGFLTFLIFVALPIGIGVFFLASWVRDWIQN